MREIGENWDFVDFEYSWEIWNWIVQSDTKQEAIYLSFNFPDLFPVNRIFMIYPYHNVDNPLTRIWPLNDPLIEQILVVREETIHLWVQLR